MDQLTEAMREFGKSVGTLYKQVIELGFSREQAMRFVESYVIDAMQFKHIKEETNNGNQLEL